MVKYYQGFIEFEENKKTNPVFFFNSEHANVIDIYLSNEFIYGRRKILYS